MPCILYLALRLNHSGRSDFRAFLNEPSLFGGGAARTKARMPSVTVLSARANALANVEGSAAANAVIEERATDSARARRMEWWTASDAQSPRESTAASARW